MFGYHASLHNNFPLLLYIIRIIAKYFPLTRFICFFIIVILLNLVFLIAFSYALSIHNQTFFPAIRHKGIRSTYSTNRAYSPLNNCLSADSPSLSLLFLAASDPQYVQQYLHRGQILRTKNDYRSGQDRLELWLESAEVTLNTTNVCTVEAVKEYAEELKVKCWGWGIG